jgi:extracellular factor (EF) 3-hydroxypalmitic acid methyl ester biosynthesis protein
VFKDSARSCEAPTGGQFDFVYCAGLFDYMTDSFCQRLLSVFYDWVAPGGLLLATNVESRNPQRYTMGYLLDWHLFNRDANDCRRIAPQTMVGDAMRIYSDLTGVNLFIEVRKARHDTHHASNGCTIP